MTTTATVKDLGPYFWVFRADPTAEIDVDDDDPRKVPRVTITHDPACAVEVMSAVRTHFPGHIRVTYVARGRTSMPLPYPGPAAGAGGRASARYVPPTCTTCNAATASVGAQCRYCAGAL